jgi:hypothetical protein
VHFQINNRDDGAKKYRLVCWSDGVGRYWKTGMMAGCSNGVVEYWKIGIMGIRVL